MICIACGSDIEDFKKVHYEDGWMHYYFCGDKKKLKSGTFIQRIEGRIPDWLQTGMPLRHHR